MTCAICDILGFIHKSNSAKHTNMFAASGGSTHISHMTYHIISHMTYHIISHKRHITWHSERPFAEFLCQASRFEILDEDIATLQQMFHNILSCNKQLQACSVSMKSLPHLNLCMMLRADFFPLQKAFEVPNPRILQHHNM